MRIVLILIGVFILSCQQKPTIVTTENTNVLAVEPSIKKLVTADTVIVDARPTFEFGLNHVPGSINIQWRDYSAPGSSNPGFLDRDKFKLARRLAMLGIDPETPVLVVGPGKEGNGSEGRLAWMFKLLGLQKVTTMNYELLRAQVARRDEVLPISKPMWKPVVQDTYEIEYEDLYKMIKAHHIANHLPTIPLKHGQPVGRKIQGTDLFVLDVRHPKDKAEFIEPQEVLAPEIIVKIPWTEFWSEQGQANHEAVQTLYKLGVKSTDEVIVLSETGVKASGVAYALHEMGFIRVHCLSGGLQFLQEMRGLKSPGAYQ